VRVKHLTIAFVILLVGGIILVNLGFDYAVSPIIRRIPGRDKIAHFVLLGLLALLLNLSFHAKRVTIAGVPLLKGSLIAWVVATIEEVSQLWLDHRDFGLDDLAAGYLGILVFGAVAGYLVRRRRKKTVV